MGQYSVLCTVESEKHALSYLESMATSSPPPLGNKTNMGDRSTRGYWFGVTMQ